MKPERKLSLQNILIIMGILITKKNQVMNSISELEEYIDANQLQHLQINQIKNQYIISLIDSTGYEIVKGYGGTIIDAINDLHSGFL